MPKVTDPALLEKLNGKPDYSDPETRKGALVELYGDDGQSPDGASVPSKKVTDPALLAKLNGKTAKPGMIESAGRGIHAGLSGRGVGIIQTMYDAGRAIGLFDQHPELEDAFKKAAANIEAEKKGTGASGFLGEMVGDPINWMAPGDGSLITAGAKIGALSSATAPSERDSNLGDRAINAATGGAVGAATGAALPVVGKTLAKAGNIASGIADRVLTAFGSKNAAERIIYANYAEKLIGDGLSPEQVTDAITKAKASGLNPTVAEATGSRGLSKYERRIASGSGEGPMKFNANLKERGRTTIPGRIEEEANKLIGPEGAVDDAYANAATEGNTTISNSMQPEGAPLAIAPPGGASAQPGLLDELTKTLGGVRQSIDARLEELGPIKNIESAALNKAKAILDNAQRRGGSFESILDAKKQLGDLFIEGADTNSQKQASRYVAQHSSALDSVLEKLAPTGYPTAKVAAKSRMAGKEMQGAVDDSGNGDVNGFLQKIWGSPGARDEFLSKVPEGARDSATQFFDTLEKIGGGFGGRQKAANAGNDFDTDMIGVSPAKLNPISMVSGAIRTIGDTFLPQLRSAATDASFNPNVERLASTMEKQGANSPVGRQAVVGLANNAAEGTTQPGPYQANDKPQSDFSPIVNSLMKLVGAGGFADQQKKRRPTQITISPDPNIGPDGLPRVNLPGPY